jgi:hypothetical protein
LGYGGPVGGTRRNWRLEGVTALHPVLDHGEDDDAELASLQAAFPQFLIWRENIHGRCRYVARSQHLNLNPHTVITDDPGELCTALSKPA